MEFRISRSSLLVSGDKVFFTLQGEGPSMGKPAVFLRLHLCNLHCAWCDTRYTWDRESAAFLDEPETWSVEQTWEAMKQFGARRAVITGGEPLLQPYALDRLISLIPSDWKVEIETNGTISPTELMVKRGIQFNVSPKLENSGNEKALRYRSDVLKVFGELREATFKFVVNSREDLREVEEIVGECRLDNDSVILMPEGVTQPAIAKHGRAIATLCREKGWRLMPRLHIMLWGKKRRT